MTYVVTRACCNDAACAAVCPVNCIHPTPDEPGYQSAELLYIDPRACIDCGACVEVCPVDAIVADVDLKPDEREFLTLNKEFFNDFSYPAIGFVEPTRQHMNARTPTLRLAVVGTGPAAIYAVEAALEATDGKVSINVFERLPTPWGLVRFGVAPDHLDTKQVSRGLERILSAPQVALYLNTSVGEHVSHDELIRSHHAIVYATGAADGREMSIPGENLPGSAAASDFVAWYNGHPEAHDLDFDLSGSTAVVIGNGNVALDVARILVSDPDGLATRSDIAEHALAKLRDSQIQDVIVLGRRGPSEAAFTTPELLALVGVPEVDIAVDPTGLDDFFLSGSTLTLKERRLFELLVRSPSGNGKRVTLRFLASPREILGGDRVSGIRIGRNALTADARGHVVASPTGEIDDQPCSLVLRAVGYRGRPIDGLPFDRTQGVFHHEAGRVVDENKQPVPGVYATGWIKRGASGVIGTNRSCAVETIESLMQDFTAGRLAEPETRADDFAVRLRDRRPESFGLDGWRAVDDHERSQGLLTNRPRVKTVDAGVAASIGRRHR